MRTHNSWQRKILTIKRRARLSLPDFIQRYDPETKGPIEFVPADAIQWLLPAQEYNYVVARQIREHLFSNGVLDQCYGYRELLAIQNEGPEFFQKLADGKTLVGWRGCVESSPGHISVPFLCLICSHIEIDWLWIEETLDKNSPALMHRGL